MQNPSGSYNRVLDLYSPSNSTDGNGDINTTFSLVVSNVPCNVLPSGGQEVYNENQRVAGNIKIFAIRYMFSITPKESWQIVYDGATYNITNVVENTKNGMKRVELLLTAQAKDNS